MYSQHVYYQIVLQPRSDKIEVYRGPLEIGHDKKGGFLGEFVYRPIDSHVLSVYSGIDGECMIINLWNNKRKYGGISLVSFLFSVCIFYPVLRCL